MENYCSSGFVKVYRIDCENSSSNEKRRSVLENKVLTRMHNSSTFSLMLTSPELFLAVPGQNSPQHKLMQHSISSATSANI